MTHPFKQVWRMKDPDVDLDFTNPKHRSPERMAKVRHGVFAAATHLLATYNAGQGIEEMTIQELTDEVRAMMDLPESATSYIADTVAEAARKFKRCEFDGENIVFYDYCYDDGEDEV